jgi:hypothetical protein
MALKGLLPQKIDQVSLTNIFLEKEMINDWKQKKVRLKVHLWFGRSVMDIMHFIVPHRPIHKLMKAFYSYKNKTSLVLFQRAKTRSH